MSAVDVLPPLGACLNAGTAALVISAFVAIRRGNRERHRRLMLAGLSLSLVFAVCYIAQIALGGHLRFPGDDWVRTLFVAILVSHTTLAVVLVPLVLRALYLAFHSRFAEHRRIAHIALPVWLYVSLTGVLFYWMLHHLRPPA